MSGVDVLAELDRRIEISRELCVVRDITETPPGLADLIEARAAVAEAIESLKLIESAKARGFGIDYAQGCASAALARCRGGAA